MRKKHLFNSIAGSAIALLTFAQPSQAIDNDFTLYLWGAGISGQATLGSKTVPQEPVDADFDDLLDKLDACIQLHYEGVGEQWGAGLDFTYLKLSDTNDANVSTTVKTTLTELFGLYRADHAPAPLSPVGVLFTPVSMDVI